MIVYHGTSDDNLDEIMEAGYIKPPVYVSDKYTCAVWFAVSRHPGVVIELDVPREWLQRDRYYERQIRMELQPPMMEHFKGHIFRIRHKIPISLIVRMIDYGELNVPKGMSLIDYLEVTR